MKLLAKILGVITLLYCLCWVGLAVYFDFAERHKNLIEDNLAEIFERPVSIDKLQTTWVGWSPSLRIDGLRVKGDVPGQPALAFDSAAVVVSPVSLFTFWPRFTDFTVQKPSLEVATLPNGGLQVAGIALTKNKNVGFNRKQLLSWLLNQSSAAWHNGDIRWRKSDGSIQRYNDISFVYQRDRQNRTLRGTVTAPKGQVSMAVNVDGNPLLSEDWDASVEVIGGDERGTGQQLLKPGDLSFKVQNGMGNIRLANLDVKRIRDFLSLSGLAEKTRWILDAQLSGLLHDVEFSFTGALTNLRDWSLRASATDVDFKSLDSLPALTNLNGELEASAKKGSFNFTAVNSRFEWSKFYAESFPIKSAQGRFTWYRNADGAFQLSLHQGQLSDPNLSIYDINADIEFDAGGQKISSFGELFTVDSIQELSFDNGDVVVGEATRRPQPLTMEASAKFDVSQVDALSTYLPNVEKISLFRRWLTKAFTRGEMTNGRARYRGQLSPTAILDGDAKLELSADFDSVTVDYAPEQDWPPATRGHGRASLVNDFLTVEPKGLWLNGDPVRDGILTIEDLFSRSILLKLNGKTSTSLAKGMAFLFQGPLIKPENRPEQLPVDAAGGKVDIEVSLDMPLRNISDLSVNGTSTIRNGSIILPEGVPVTEINSVVAFTERTVTADAIRAQFLGGETKAKLITTEEAQPPKMRLQGTGLAKLEQLSPWVGEHVLTWFSGETSWNGSVDIDGSNLLIKGDSDLLGVAVSAPKPLSKNTAKPAKFNLAMDLGGTKANGQTTSQSLKLDYGDVLRARFQAESDLPTSSLFDQALIQVGSDPEDLAIPAGINIAINHPVLDVDELLDSVIDLAQYQPVVQSDNTDFLDALRSVTISTPSATSLSRPFGVLNASINSTNGWAWSGTLEGDNINGRLSMEPRNDIGRYTLKLKKLIIGPAGDVRAPAERIDKGLRPADYPEVRLTVDELRLDGRQLGALDFIGRPIDDFWKIDKFALVHNGIRTTAAGGWVNNAESGSLSAFDFSTVIDEAEGALNDMDFEGYIRKGRGNLGGTVEWAGAPHEFDYSRLNGKFDLFVKDGELVQVEPGSGKLIGLLNFNTIARRLAFDFRDVFASGLQFDRMRYRGLLSSGEAILQDAFILTPAVFVRMEGKLDLDKELIDMDVHISPELGGNLTLLTALANPAAGAVVFLTSQIFKDDMRRASFKSYQAKGTWEGFEMVEIDSEGNPTENNAGLAEPQANVLESHAVGTEATRDVRGGVVRFEQSVP